ncbi:MAG: protein kinase [Planctomycetota bacterium]
MPRSEVRASGQMAVSSIPVAPMAGGADDDVDDLEVVDDPSVQAATGWSDSAMSTQPPPEAHAAMFPPGVFPAGEPPAQWNESSAPGSPSQGGAGGKQAQWDSSSAAGTYAQWDSSAPGAFGAFGSPEAVAVPIDDQFGDAAAGDNPPPDYGAAPLNIGVDLPKVNRVPDSIRHTPVAMRRFKLPEDATQGAEPMRSMKPQIDPNREELTPGPFGDFILLNELGRGAMGIVYLAEWPRYQRKVAIKVLSTRKTQEVRHRKRFMREARICTSLNHPNLVKVYMVDEISNRYYMAMELIEGPSLSEVIRDRGRLQPEYVLPLLGQVMPGIQLFHNAGVIHRDIKPDNIMIREVDNIPKVTDFGLARLVGAEISKLTAAGKAVGTPYFMAPEQILQPDTVDHRVDLYASGVTLYYSLTLSYPYEGRKANDVLLNIARRDPVPISERRGDMPRAVNELVMRMIARDPDDRFQNATELGTAIQKAISRL